MARLFYFTMGFHENFALRRLASHGVDSRDSILVATLKPAIPGVKDAFESLRLYASKSGVRRIELLEVPLDPVGGLASSAFFILDRLHRYVSLGYRLIVADLTGGSRPLIVASMIALIMASESADIDLWLQSDTGGSWESRMPPGIISLIKRGLSREKEALLVFLAEKPGASVEELTERLGSNSKTVRNHLSTLKSWGLVYQRGRGGGYYLSSWGRLLAKASSRERAG